MERLRKKLSEQESLLLLMSPSMAFRVHSRNGKVSASLWSRLTQLPAVTSSRMYAFTQPLHSERDHCSVSHVPLMVLWAIVSIATDSAPTARKWQGLRGGNRVGIVHVFANVTLSTGALPGDIQGH